MQTLTRSLWIARATGSGQLLAYVVLGFIADPGALTGAALAVGLAFVLLATAQTRALAAAIHAGNEGELLLAAGPRVPIARLRASRRADNAESAATVGLGVLLGATLLFHPDPLARLVAVMGFTVALTAVLFTLSRRPSAALLEANAALWDFDLDRAERILRVALRSRQPAVTTAAEGLSLHLALRRGRVAEARQALSARFTGALNHSAAHLGLIQLGEGDPSLCVRWLAAQHTDSRYDHFLRALLEARLGLHRRDYPAALRASRADIDLPHWFRRDLRLTEAAALQGLGNTTAAKAVLDSLPQWGRERWLAAVDAELWRLIEDADAERVTASSPIRTVAPTPAPPPARSDEDPFAAPVQDRPGKPGPGRLAGAIPVESMVLGTRRSRYRTPFVIVLSSLLVVVGSLLLFLWAVLFATDSGATLGFEPWIGAFAILIGLAIALESVAQLGFVGTGTSGLTLSDGRVVGGVGLTLWALGGLLPLVTLTGVLLVLVPLVLFGFGAPLWPMFGLAPIGVLFGLATVIRLVSLRVVWAAHTEPAAHAVARIERHANGLLSFSPQARLWLGLALLWSGDGARAEKETVAITSLYPHLSSLAAWFRAGRGEIDLARALSESDPTELGDRYRWAVTVALTALQAGRAQIVADRLQTWRAVAAKLPNRFGGLLAHLCDRIDAQVREAEAPALPADLGGLAKVWPFIA